MHKFFREEQFHWQSNASYPADLRQKYRYRVYAVFQSPRGMAGSKPSNEVEIKTKKRGDQ